MPTRRRSGRTARRRRSPANHLCRTQSSTTARRRRARRVRPLVRRGDRGHRVGVHERVGAVEGVERPHQPFEGLAVGTARSRPRRQPHAVAEPPGQGEHVDGAALAELGLGGVERAVEIRQIRRRRRRGGTARPAACAGRRTSRRAACAATSGSRRRPCSRLLGQRVERFDAGRGEREEVVGRAAVDARTCRRTRPRAPAIAATASSTGTSHGSPTPSATGRTRAAAHRPLTGRCSCGRR